MELRAKAVEMGKTGIKVSQVCFGTEHINCYTPDLGGKVLADAARYNGVFFWDTDMVYGSHPQIAAGLTKLDRQEVVVCSKTYATTAVAAERDLERIFAELRPAYLDFCLLHRVRVDLEAARPALEVLGRAKEKGLIRAVGISTHFAAVARQAARMPEIEVICVPLNRDGSRIDEGSRDEMVESLKTAHAAGKGTYVIKTLGRGDLLYDLEGALEWVLQHHEYIDVYNIGFANLAELRQDLAIVNAYFARERRE